MTAYNELKDSSVINNATKNLGEHGFEVIVVDTKEEALEKIKELVPKGASVMNGTSRTLEEIGYIDYLKSGTHEWDNLHEKILAEQDQAKQNLLRKQMTVADFYMGSAHAVTETGEVLVASNTGSQLPSLAFNASNIILVVSTQKIAQDLSDGMKRIEDYVVPLEDERMKSVGYSGTMYSKLLVFRREPAFLGRKFRVILVKEKLGF